MATSTFVLKVAVFTLIWRHVVSEESEAVSDQNPELTHPLSGVLGGAVKKTNPDPAAECMMWSKLENKTLPLQNQGHAHCTTNAQCTGFDCIGTYQEKELTFGMRVLPCRNTPGVEIYGYAPQFNAQNFSHVFTHQSRYEVPGASLNLSLIKGLQPVSDVSLMKGILEVHIKKNKDGKSLMLGLIALGCIQNKCLFKKTIFNHTKLPIPSCEKLRSQELNNVFVNDPCDPRQRNSCGSNQLCRSTLAEQDEDNLALGLCVCKEGFKENEQRLCSSMVSQQPIIAPAPNDQILQESSTISPESGSKGIVLIVICVLVVLILLVAIGFAIILRTRFAPRLRARLTSTPYEDIIISKNEQTAA